ncbi:MAG: PKD domain-containing protein [Bacteroidota bacterium]|jgi:PKD repeat protein
MKKNLFFGLIALWFCLEKVNAQCNASFNFNTVGNTTFFSNTSTVVNDSIINYQWSFGDGGSDTTQNPSHNYTNCGGYIINLTITTQNNCTSSITDTIFINGNPNVNINVSIDTTNGDVTFNATPNLPGYFFSWDFSNGATGVGANITSNFLPGQQWGCTIISDNLGACATDTFCTFFNVNYTPATCQASFNYTSNGTSITFNNTSTAPGDSITGYQWGFGNFQSSTAVNPTQNYTSCGDYIVQLTMYTASGCSNSILDTIQVSAQIAGNYTFTVDTLTGTAQFFSTPNNSNYSFAWDFGDGSFGGGANPSHAYAEGTYTACVIISNISTACVPDTICNVVFVDIDTIPVTCSATWTNVSNGTNQTFIADSLNFNDTFNWDFGDGNTGTGAIANYTYASPGTYTVCLNYTSSTTGCTAQFCDTVDIPACSMQITHTGTDGNITFNATVSGGGIFPVVVWSFGDGSTGTGLNPTHQYTSNGFKVVCAILNPSPLPGCKDTVCTFLNITGVGIEEHQLEKSLTISPNPFNDQLLIEFNLNANSDYQISISDISGKEILKQEKIKNQIGQQQNKIEVSALSTGMYFVCLEVDGKLIRRRIIKN